MTNKRKAFIAFKRNKLSLIGFVLVLILIVLAVFAPFIAPCAPTDQNISLRMSGLTCSHLFGTDRFGRDVFSRVIYGARISLLIGISAITLGALVGSTLGLIAGFKGGTTENMIMRVIDFLMSFPSILMGLLVITIMGSGLTQLVVAIGITFIPRFARIVHGPTLALREKDYVSAALAAGAGTGRVLFRHLLPNLFGDVLVMGTLWLGMAIRVEASLSFLGFGIAPPTPTWGNMIRSGVDSLTNAPWITIFPGIAIFYSVLAFNLIGDGLRDISDPRLRGE